MDVTTSAAIRIQLTELKTVSIMSSTHQNFKLKIHINSAELTNTVLEKNNQK